jgi:leucyl-tRNA synthetase
MDCVAAQASVSGANSLNDVEFGREAKLLRREIHSVLKQVDYDYQRMQYNTVVSGAMKMINALESMAPTLAISGAALPPEGASADRGGPSPIGSSIEGAGGQVALIEGFGILLRCLYPATPHIAHTLWSELGYAGQLGDILDAPWPKVDEVALQQDEIELMLQINGKLRGSVVVPSNASREVIEAAALASSTFAQFAGGAAAKKVIVVPGRLVNVVI